MLFKILHGDKDRISMDITQYHEGYCYVTYDGDFYVDMNNQRVKLNAKDAETISGMSFENIKMSIGAISYNEAQILSETQKAQARSNIGVMETTIGQEELISMLEEVLV